MCRFDPNAMEKYFQKRFNKPISLIFTDNFTSMISVREKHDTIYVRLHRIFLNADNGTLEEVVRFIKRKGGNTPAIKAFIRINKSCLKDTPPRRIRINPNGRIYNLTEIFNALNKEYFNGSLSTVITWGKKSPRYAVRKRTLGSYQKKTNTIRINPVLDRRKVPRYFIEFIVYHEMIHAVIDPVVRNGRRAIHSKEFKNRECEYRYFHKAIEWKKIT